MDRLALSRHHPLRGDDGGNSDAGMASEVGRRECSSTPRTGKSFRFVRACVRAVYPMSVRTKNVPVESGILYLLARASVSFISDDWLYLVSQRISQSVLEESSQREYSNRVFKESSQREFSKRVLEECSRREFSRRALKGVVSKRVCKLSSLREFSRRVLKENVQREFAK